MKNAALGVALGLSALVGCQGPSQQATEAETNLQSPSLTALAPTRNGERLEFKGIALDQSFFRMAYKPMPTDKTQMSAWLKGHPRLAGVPQVHIDRMAAVLSQRGDVAVNNVGNAQLLSTTATWTLAETHGMNTSAGVFVVDSANPSNTTDRVVVEGAGAGTAGDPAHYIGIVSNIYTASPTVTKSPAIDSAIDGSALLLSIDGSQIYALSSAGTLYAIKLSDATIAWQLSMGAAVSWSTPWIDFGNGDIFVADTGGRLTSVSSAGAQKWKTTVSSTALHSSPIQFASQVFVGADDGKLYRVNSTTGALIGNPMTLCLTASCISLDQIWGGPAIDTLNNNNKLIIPANKRLIQVDLNACTAATTTCTFTGFKIDEANFTSQQGRIFGSPTIDNAAGGFIYIGHDNRLWRATYNNGISGNFTRATTPNPTGVLRGWNTGNEYPRGIPIVFNNQIFVGDGGGWLHRFDTTTWSESAQKSFAGVATPDVNGPTIDSTPLIDFFGGNVYLGTRQAGGTGSWVSLAQSFTSDAATAGGTANKIRVESSSTATAGVPFSVTLTVLDAQNNPATGYTGTVQFTSTDAGGATLPANYTFVAGDAGTHTFANATTLATTGAVTLTATDTVTASTKGSTIITVAPGAVAKFSIVTYPASNTTASGTANTIAVQALDSLNHVVTSYTGTVTFTSSDPQATLPANFTFTSSQGGSGTFWYSTTLRTVGAQTVTVKDVGSPSLTGTLSLNVTVGTAKTLTVTAAPASSAAGATTTVTVTAKDAGGNTVTGYVGTVAFTSTDGAATLPGNYTFVAGDNGTHSFSATLRTVGGRTITATDTVTSTIKGSGSVNVTAGGVTHLSVYNYPASASVTHGTAMTVGVQALDAANNVVSGYTGTIHFTSNDGTATLPANWTFTTAGAGTATFWYSTKLNAIGAGKTVTATDTVTGSITGTLTVQVL